MKANKIIFLVSMFFLMPHSLYANAIDNFRQQMSCYTLECSHWYVSGNIGVSHLHDTKAPRSKDSVDENGPGFSAFGGYQFNSVFGAELGYTQYHDSRETIGTATGSSTIAKTEHYAVTLAATGKLPLAYGFSARGKLGLAYSYANKIFIFGPSASSGAVSLYYGLGFLYSITPKADLVAEWASVRGNNYTGSSELYSLGFTFAIV